MVSIFAGVMVGSCVGVCTTCFLIGSGGGVDRLGVAMTLAGAGE